MKTKLKLNELKVKSFVTALSKPVENTVAGGARTRRDDVTDCCTYHPRRCG